MPSQTFTTSGTWSCPSDYLPGSLIVQCWGPGGNGAGGLSGTRSGGGGGGGEWAQDTPTVTAGSNYTVTVGTGGSVSSTTFVGDNLTVTAHGGGNSSGTGQGAAGSGSTNASHNSGGHGGSGLSGTAAAGGGGSCGDETGAGGIGGNGTSTTGGAGGTSGGTGGAGGTGGTGTAAGGAGTAPGGGGGGGGNRFSTNGAAGGGADGQVILTWSVIVITTLPENQRRRSVAPQLAFSTVARMTQAFPVQQLPVNAESIRSPQHLITQFTRHRRLVAPSAASDTTGVQPPEIPSSEHARFKPPYPRRGVTITQFPTPNVPPAESYRARFKPPYPRRGVVAPTGRPVPVQPPTPGSAAVFPHLRTRRRRLLRGTMLWPGTPPVAVQPPWSSWVYKRRWSKPLFPRRGVVPPEALPTPPIVTAFNPTSLRRIQRYQWFRRGNVAQTGWPVPVQPPMTSQSLRRWYKPPWPRKGVTPPTNIPEPVPTSWWMRRPQHYQWFRRGRALPGSGLPVPVQPPNVPHSVRRSMLRPLLVRHKSQPFSAFFIPVQPPERMQSVRRWTRPLWPRRGRTDIATLPGLQLVTGYQVLPIQTFTYIPGGPGIDLTNVNLSLFPLNRLGVTFWNPYGDVILIVKNTTIHPATIQPQVIRTVEKQSVQLPAYTLQPGVMQAFGPFPPNDFSIPAGTGTATGDFYTDVYSDTYSITVTLNEVPGYMQVNVSAGDSGIYSGAFHLVTAPPIGHTGKYDLLGARLRRLIREHHIHTHSTPGDIHPGDSTPGA